MNAIEANLDIYLGSALDASITCYSDSDKTIPTDFTGYSGQGGIFAAFPEDETAPTELAPVSVTINAPATDGQVNFTMTKAQVALLETVGPGEYVWDALMWASSAEEEVWFRGVARVHAKGTVRV